MNNIILCGLQKCGKTTLGKRLAFKLGIPFFDTDCLLEQTYAENTGLKLSCREIYVKEGQLAFRALEKQQILLLAAENHSVIALGGGSLDDPGSAHFLQQLGVLVYLKTPFQVIWERLKFAALPAYLHPVDAEKSFRAMVQQRLPLYEALATHIVDTRDSSEEALVNAILDILNLDFRS